jgi:cytochrome c oxidase subunit I
MTHISWLHISIYIVFGGTGFAFMAAMHYWFPKMFGRKYDPFWANAGWLIIFHRIHHPLRTDVRTWVHGHAKEVLRLCRVSSMAGTYLLLWCNYSWKQGWVYHKQPCKVGHFRKKGTEENPWGGITLEWKVPSPPPLENFEEIPTDHQRPYDYS